MSHFSGFSNHQLFELLKPLNELKICSLCPHNCMADRGRFSKGYCKTKNNFSVSSIISHNGEEPVISGKNGICNVFFAHCSMQCIYCQNFQISNNKTGTDCFSMRLNEIIEEIINNLDNGCHAVGFVSPSHMIPQMKIIIKAINLAGRKPIIVYNSNCYDKVEVLKTLEGIVDVYLPDLKYMDTGLGNELSDVPDYPEIAGMALKEMYRQKGATLVTDDEERAVNGLIVRHLVLPGYIDNSKKVLNFIANELSTKVCISLMSQYFPVYKANQYGTLNRPLLHEEYEEVKREFERLGFYKGWVQELDSSLYYRPDFQNNTPFQ